MFDRLVKQLTGVSGPAAQCATPETTEKSPQKVGYRERKRLEKEKQQRQMDKEQNSMLRRHIPQLRELLRDSNQDFGEQRKQRKEIREYYDQHVALQKYKFNMRRRLQHAENNVVALEINKFALDMLWLRTDDEVVYQYQRKLQRMMQYELAWKQTIPVLSGLFLFKLTRRLKKANPTDVFYFMIPYLYANWGIFCVEQKKMYEAGFPAHPFVIERRMDVINKTCFNYPQIIKNEIEYLHSKLSEHHAAKTKNSGEGDENADEPLLFEQVFTIGQVTSDYKRLLKKQAKQEVPSKEEEEKNLLKFKIIVDDGELYLQCIDEFEEIFEINREAMQHLELTELLDPFMFDSHRDIINALFEVYYSLSQEYLKCGAEEFKNTSLADQATQKLKQQYNLDEDSDLKDTAKTSKTIREAASKV